MELARKVDIGRRWNKCSVFTQSTKGITDVCHRLWLKRYSRIGPATNALLDGNERLLGEVRAKLEARQLESHGLVALIKLRLDTSTLKKYSMM